MLILLAMFASMVSFGSVCYSCPEEDEQNGSAYEDTCESAEKAGSM